MNFLTDVLYFVEDSEAHASTSATVHPLLRTALFTPHALMMRHKLATTGVVAVWRSLDHELFSPAYIRHVYDALRLRMEASCRSLLVIFLIACRNDLFNFSLNLFLFRLVDVLAALPQHLHA